MPQLAIVIINYNTGDLISSCLEGIFSSPPTCHFAVVLVNNGPPNEIDESIHSNYPGIHIQQNAFNLGFAAAANLGASLLNAPDVLFLNPDVIPQSGSWVCLWETLQTHPSAGMVVPKLVNPDGSLQYSCRRFYRGTILILRRFPLNRIFPDHPLVQHHLMQEWEHTQLREIDWALGAAMLVRRAAIPGRDIFDPRFFLYFEDVDLCFRLWQNGWKVLYEPAAVMVHRHRRESARRIFHPVKGHHFSSLVKFLWKHRFRLSPFRPR
jgi:N-acetylglucosaminyl-diphospho-decaprenol L-rhamnosyltransferase